jgi:hypothetical protein
VHKKANISELDSDQKPKLIKPNFEDFVLTPEQIDTRMKPKTFREKINSGDLKSTIKETLKN